MLRYILIKRMQLSLVALVVNSLFFVSIFTTWAAEGAVDPAYNANLETTYKPDLFLLQHDDRFLVKNPYGPCDVPPPLCSTTARYVRRLNLDGSQDAGFGIFFTPSTNVAVIAEQSGGRIVIGGPLGYNARPFYDMVVRVNDKGERDTSFQMHVFYSGIRTMVVQKDDKVLVGGSFDYEPVYKTLTRLNSDGTLDNSFVPFPVDKTVTKLLLQNDNKILVVSHPTDIYNYSLTRLNSDGSLDTTFNNPTTFDYIRTMFVQSDGKILISVSSPNGVGDKHKLIRLNSNGSLDASFGSGVGANGAIHAIALQDDGKLLLGGSFTNYNGLNRSRLVRLNSDGSVDTSFATSADDAVFYIAKQSDGKFIISGWFTTVGGYRRVAVARLENNAKTTSSTNLVANTNQTSYRQSVTFQASVTPATATGTVTFEFGKNFPAATVDIVNGQASYTTNQLPAGNYEVQALYNGSATLQGSPSQLASLAVTKAPTTINLTSSANPGVFGQAVTFQAGVTPATATGTVTLAFGNGIPSTTLTITNGLVSYTTDQMPVGSYSLQATYNGSDNFQASNGAPYNQLINPAATSLTLTSAANPSVYGQPVVFTASVASLAPGSGTPASGAVTFNFPGGSSLPVEIVGGLATYVTNTLPAGTHPVTASYSGNFSYSASQTAGPLNQIVEKAPSQLSLTSNANPSVVGRAIIFKVKLAPLPVPASSGGTANFNFDGGITIPVELVDGVASYMTTTLGVGSYSLNVSYTGDANHKPGNSATYTQYVVAGCDPLLVTSASDDGQAGSCGTLSYALARTISGRISFELPGGSNLISLSGVLTPTLHPGVELDGGASGVVVSGNGTSGDGLRLSGNNLLRNLTITGFGGRQLVVVSGAGGNVFYHVKLVR